MYRRTRYCSEACLKRAKGGHLHWCADHGHSRPRNRERHRAAVETRHEADTNTEVTEDVGQNGVRILQT
jgi:hypothetical protein